MVRHAPRPARHPVDVHLGTSVRARRQAMGLTQEALGVRLGLSYAQIQKYENGANRMNAVVLYDIAVLLECSVGDLYAGLAGTSPRPALDGAAAHSAAQDARAWGELRDIFLRLRPDLRGPLVAFIRNLSPERAAPADPLGDGE